MFLGAKVERIYGIRNTNSAVFSQKAPKTFFPFIKKQYLCSLETDIIYTFLSFICLYRYNFLMFRKK